MSILMVNGRPTTFMRVECGHGLLIGFAADLREEVRVQGGEPVGDEVKVLTTAVG